MKITIRVAILLAGLSFLNSSYAGVSLKNGNFFIAYDDIPASGLGPGLQVQRVYNSKSSFLSMFGWGWGTLYDEYLSCEKDGSLVMHEYGGGAENVFRPKSNHNQAPPDGLSRVPLGAVYTAAQFEPQTLTRLKDGFLRSNGSTSEWFDLSGRLTRRTDNNGNSVSLEYGQNGRPIHISDSSGNRLDLRFDDRGLLVKIEANGGSRAKYQYNDNKELVYSVDADDNKYVYRYSADGLHNLTAVGYSDGSELDVYYHPEDLHQNVLAVRERDGVLTRYDYHEFRVHDNAARRIETVTEKKFVDKDPDKIYHIYQWIIEQSGNEWLNKYIRVHDGRRKETTYNKCCGKPVAIEEGNYKRFSYDDDGRVTREESLEELKEYEYNSFNKITSVKISDPLEQDTKPRESTFTYDSNGNLTSATSPDGRTYVLAYDDRGRITTLSDSMSGRTIRMSYTSMGKPETLEVAGVGKLNVTYGQNGEVVDVRGPQNKSDVSSTISEIFNGLVATINPAGISLDLL